MTRIVNRVPTLRKPDNTWTDEELALIAQLIYGAIMAPMRGETEPPSTASEPILISRPKRPNKPLGDRIEDWALTAILICAIIALICGLIAAAAYLGSAT